MLDRLPESTLAILAELRDLALALSPRLRALPAGSPVRKVIRGRTYWYLQSRGGGLDVQHYIGPESEELLDRMDGWRRLRAELAPELATLDRLNDMAIAGGAPHESAAATGVLELLGASGLFREGAVLVGTRAFVVYGGLLGFRAPAAARTQDLDVALARTIALALPRRSEGLAARLGETTPPFLPVPDLDPRRPSTSFKLRGRELRVDFVTPRRSREPDSPVPIPAFGIAAWPLELLDFLIDSPMQAVLCGVRPVLVSVPQPARFALHKLWLSGQRPASETVRAAKDLAQAETLLELLIEDRPRDLRAAAEALRTRPRVLAALRREARRLSEISSELLPLLTG